MATYKDLEELGRGGFGAVYKCERERDGELFARKYLFLDDTGSIKRFQREVRIMQKLHHPGIVSVIDANLGSSPYWYVMPLYPRCLAPVIPELTGDRERALRLFDAILGAVEHAHHCQIIHRDLKPENVLVNECDLPVITDFGLGRALDALTSRATGTVAFIGTQGYMAPEQMTQAANADPRSDIFALGRMLYEMLTGEPRVAIQDHTKLPVGLGAIVQKCTATDPGKRYQSVTELREAIRLVASRRSNAVQELQELSEKILQTEFVSSSDIHRLAQLFGACRDESELLHELAMKIPGSLFRALEEHVPEAASLLAHKFAESVKAQGWDFGYTDSIGGACEKIYDATHRPEIKGLMTAAALQVGVSHNRWHVMDIAAALIARARSDDEALAVAHAIRNLDGYGDQIVDRLTIRRLNPILQEVFLPKGS